MEIAQYFTASVAFSMVGGVFGAMIASIREHDRPIQFVLEAGVSAIAAAAVAENYLPPQVWLCAIAGVGVGLMAGTAVDVLSTAAPKIMQRALQGALKSILARISGAAAGVAAAIEAADKENRNDGEE